jgi:hypothetical protein
MPYMALKLKRGYAKTRISEVRTTKVSSVHKFRSSEEKCYNKNYVVSFAIFIFNDNSDK